MLDKNDKQWISNLLQEALARERSWMKGALDEMLKDITQTMADGFSECASVKQMEEVKSELAGLKTELGDAKANIGSLEQRFTWMHGAMVTKEYFDKRMTEHKEKEEQMHKQQNRKTARLVHELHANGRLSTSQSNAILSLDPYPQKLNPKSR